MAALFKMPCHSGLPVNCITAAVSTPITAPIFRATDTNSNYVPINTQYCQDKSPENKR